MGARAADCTGTDTRDMSPAHTAAHRKNHNAPRSQTSDCCTPHTQKTNLQTQLHASGITSGEHLLTPHLREVGENIRAGLSYREETSVLAEIPNGTHTGPHTTPIVTLPYADARALTTSGSTWRNLCVFVTIQCDDGAVLTTRAEHITDGGKTYPVAESLEENDTHTGRCIFLTGAYRALKEELGIIVAASSHPTGSSPTEPVGVSGTVVAAERVVVAIRSFRWTGSCVVAAATARIHTDFDTIYDAWTRASHQDEGQPLLLPAHEAGAVVREEFPWAPAMFAASNRAATQTRD